LAFLSRSHGDGIVPLDASARAAHACATINVGVGMSVTSRERPFLAPVVAVAGFAVTLLGASIEGFASNTWWGVIGDPPGETAVHVPFMVSGAPALVLGIAIVLPLIARPLRLWFGPAVAMSAIMWIGQLAAWILLYRDLTSAVVPSGGSVVMILGLLVTAAAGIADAVDRRRRTSGSHARDRKPPIVAAAALAAVAIGASLPVLARNNRWGTPVPPIPRGVNPPKRGTSFETWWGILGPDPQQAVGPIAQLAVVALPLLVLVVALVLSLSAPSARPWFGPAVAVGTLMWFAWFVAWWGIYEDHVDSVEWGLGFMVMLVGLTVAFGAALVDGLDELEDPVPV
jgi:hypothetical protein